MPTPMPPVLIDGTTGGYAVLLSILSAGGVVFVRWLFNTRRDLRTDKQEKRVDRAEETAVSVYEKSTQYLQARLDFAQARVQYLEDALLRKDATIESLRAQLDEERRHR